MTTQPVAPPPSQAPPFAKALPWLLFISLIFFLNFISRVIFSPLMVSIEADLGISHARAGRFFLDISLGYCSTVLISGLISSRLGHRRTIALMPLLMGVTLLVLSLSRSALLTEVLLVLFGMSAGFYFPSGVAAVVDLARPESMGKALSIHELAPNLSFIVAPILAELLMPLVGWRGVLAVLGGFSLFVAVLFILFGKAPTTGGQPPNFSRALATVKKPAFWFLALGFTLAVGSSFGTYSVLPLYLVDERGYSPDKANALLALSRLPGPVVVLMAGVAVDRIGARAAIFLSLALTGLATLGMGMLHGKALYACVLVQPVLPVAFFPAAFALMTRYFPGKEQSMALSLIVPAAILLGGGLLPAGLGALGDNALFWAGFVGLGAVGLAAPILAPLASDRMNLK